MKKQEIRQENHVTLQGANGEGWALDRALGEEEAHNHGACYRGARCFCVGVSSGSLRAYRLGDWENKMQD